ncbi:hypothetical protein GALL_409020 [mine drainage metagenome]|uniref:DUF4865 domain-containing protein n=1 Tax=mine drainage metagenome TaxID=410659 RepID=A0A1J5Q114_9ZZZZ
MDETEDRMLAMQYSFTLPADYDMSIIRRRIETKGHLTDGFPQLVFKAFLHAGRDSQRNHAPENLYAPFYLWDRPEGMNRFLGSQGFTAVTQAFGWPSVKIWSVWHARVQPNIAAATRATREVIPIRPYAHLSDLGMAEIECAQADVDAHGALCAVSGFDPGAWTLVRFRLWLQDRDIFDREGVQAYDVGHLSLPANGGAHV